MKIIHFLYDHPSNPWLGGGGAYRAHHVNKCLIDQGHEIKMISGGFNGEVSESSGIPTFFTPKSNFYLFSRLYYSLFAFWISKKYKADIIIDDTSCYSPSFAFLSKIPSVGMLHHLNGPSSKVKFGILGTLISWVEKSNLSRYKSLITISKVSTESALNIGFSNSQITEINAGVFLPTKDFLSSFEQRKNQILFLGRLEVYNKGLDQLANIWRAFSDNSYELIIAGAGKDEKKVKELFNEFNNVSFTGRISDLKKAELYSESKALIMPSRYEGWGMVSMEAMAYGTPVLASNISGLKEAVGEENKDRLVEFEDIKAWAQHLKNLLSNAPKWNEISELQRKRAQKYSWQSVALKHEDLYQSLIEKRNR